MPKPEPDGGFLSGLMERTLGGAREFLGDPGDMFRYGMSGNEKARQTAQGEIPLPAHLHQPNGAINSGDPNVERYASNYLGAKKHGAIPASFFNAIAFDDAPDVMGSITLPGQHMSWMDRKAAGIDGALAGAPDTSPMVKSFLMAMRDRLRAK